MKTAYLMLTSLQQAQTYSPGTECDFGLLSTKQVAMCPTSRKGSSKAGDSLETDARSSQCNSHGNRGREKPYRSTGQPKQRHTLRHRGPRQTCKRQRYTDAHATYTRASSFLNGGARCLAVFGVPAQMYTRDVDSRRSPLFADPALTPAAPWFTFRHHERMYVHLAVLYDVCADLGLTQSGF